LALSNSAAKVQNIFHICKLFCKKILKKFQKEKLYPLLKIVFLLIFNGLSKIFGKLAL